MGLLADPDFDAGKQVAAGEGDDAAHPLLPAVAAFAPHPDGTDRQGNIVEQDQAAFGGSCRTASRARTASPLAFIKVWGISSRTFYLRCGPSPQRI